MPTIPDLHTHSTASDGTLTPTELIVRAGAAGVRVLALTDHDNTDGLAEAAQAADAQGLILIPGVEISVTWNALTVHVVGLRLDPANAQLQAGLARLMAFRVWRAEEIGRRLAKHGIEDAYAGARALARGRLVGRTHFARFLVKQGRAADTNEVFRHFLTRGNPGHVPGDWASLEEAVGWIRGAGGLAVIAHPARYDLTRARMQRLLGEFRELGGVGLEVVTGSHSRDETLTFARQAREQHLRASAGSDYHGPENPWIELGRLPSLPDGCVPIWRDWPELVLQEPCAAYG
ncbi:PHP domain-containing protein [Thermochromatium tepidum]|uniref:PHP domain-containing protein n=1 Tax=Thermochromatium tepidum ATCC 43061 TaxID=316276 RepID=A0A6I6E633_THETI|nr:PHP domain-containing protein [Thermochromatium tepidum]QGU32133.1 PHP domain-containing protein [Thermochromatium tepidum ATCC 43061]